MCPKSASDLLCDCNLIFDFNRPQLAVYLEQKVIALFVGAASINLDVNVMAGRDNVIQETQGKGVCDSVRTWTTIPKITLFNKKANLRSKRSVHLHYCWIFDETAVIQSGRQVHPRLGHKTTLQGNINIHDDGAQLPG